ncbi:uncharacterized protein A4U43_C04F1590 [Asparagus officinalis]|uniref:Exonuclease domain-containing protein n=1 Tax=Asparagus officinalis TaxID=4686 RepID=A0A5P1EZ92_ASPOF|nr:uncharacterized protein A4U43_C04F1590 [Asparagus officinalis]
MDIFLCSIVIDRAHIGDLRARRVAEYSVYVSLDTELPGFEGYLAIDVCDLKSMARWCGLSEKLGLMKIAEKLGIERTGHRHHQAGHDSMLIGEVFWAMKKRFGLKEDGLVGSLYGVETSGCAPMRTPPWSCCCCCRIQLSEATLWIFLRSMALLL